MKKKILIFVDWFEPGYKAGGPIQSCRNLVKALGDNFSFFIVTSDRDLGDRSPYAHIIVGQWMNYDSNTKVFYTPPHQLTRSLLKRLVQEVQPDCLYLNSMFSYRFTILPLLLKGTGVTDTPIVVAPRGMLQQGAMQFKSAKKKIFLSLLNILGIPKKIFFHATDEEERKDIQRYFPRVRGVSVMGNFPKMDPVEWRQTVKTKGRLLCVFLSRIAPKKNLLFLLSILQKIPAEVSLQLAVAGEQEDPLYFEKCAEAGRRLPANVELKWIGPVPNDSVLEFYKQFHVFVLPTLGENFGHAIYEALLAGKPVIVSDQTPWKNLAKERIGADISLNAADLFLHMLTEFAWMDQEEYDQWSKNAFDYAIRFRNDDGLKSKYLELFSEEHLKS